METSLLIDNTNDLGSDAACLSGFEGRSEFAPPGTRVLRSAGVSVGIRIASVARSAVGDLYQQRVAKPAQLRTHSDRLIIGMRDDDHDLAFDRLALDKALQNLSRSGAGN